MARQLDAGLPANLETNLLDNIKGFFMYGIDTKANNAEAL